VPTSRPHGLAAALVLVVMAAAPLRAQQTLPTPLQPKPDLVTLTNGEHLEGEIKVLEKGRLSFDMSATGVISIKWDHVSALTSDRMFLVDTDQGAQILGTLVAASAGMLRVQTVAAAWDFELPAVVGIVPIRRSFLQRLDGSINLGGSVTQASGVAQFSVTFNVKARRPRFEWRIKAEDYVTFQRDGATSERFTTSLGYSHDITGRWALFAGGQVERNPDLGFDLRGTIAGGIERKLIRSNRSELTVGAGVGGSREVPVEGSNESLVPGLLTMRHSFYTYDTPKTSLVTALTALPILNQSGRWRLEANTSVSREIFKDLTIALSFYESYDNRPPSAEARKNDAGSTISVGFTF
jgi:hypothetical protein